ncbi:MAG: LTA synthase family protein [Nitrospirae bacterium]|nr:LTA synthase family protein [Nitrospirota bacterium]
MKRVALFFISLMFLLVSLLLYRTSFLLKYADLPGLNAADLLSAFLVGLRFDLSTSAYVLIPFAVLVFLPLLSDSKKYMKLVLSLNLCWLVALDTYLFADLLYYPFSRRHLSFELFSSKGDMLSVARTGLLAFPLDFLLFSLLLAGLILSYFFIFRRVLRDYSYAGRPLSGKLLMNAAGIILIAAFSIIAARGGTQMKPMKYSDAFAFHSPFLGQLALNGIYTTMRTYYSFRENREMKGWEKRLCPEEEAAKKGQEMIVSPDREEVPDARYPLYRHFRYGAGEFRPLNVVIFVMESWSSKFVGALGGEDDATPFFSRLSREGVLFRNFFSNGQRSTEAISSILTSIPPSGGMILSQSGALSQMPAKFLPALLREKGYATFFIHGAKYGSMGFNALAKQTGLDGYISKEDIMKTGGRDDHVWGVYDEDTFLYAHRLFAAQRKPFLAVIFSLSSHTPYQLPSERFRHYKPARPFHDFLDSLRYSDYALSRFFDEARKAEYFGDTLFVIVGDHTEGRSTGDNLSDRFSVPCLIYAPRYLKPAVLPKTATQIDLVPTILDILKSRALHASFGKSVFDDREGIGLASFGNADVFLKGGWMLVFLGNEVTEAYRFPRTAKTVYGTETPEVAALKKDEGHYVQFFHDLIVHNRLYPHDGKEKP